MTAKYLYGTTFTAIVLQVATQVTVKQEEKILENRRENKDGMYIDIYAHPMPFYTLYAAMSCEQFLFFLILLLEPVNFQWRRKVESAFFCM